VSEVAVVARVSIVPSPQLTVKLVTAPGELVTVNITVTVAPSLAGLGKRLLIVTTGAAPGLTVSEAAALPVKPAASVAFTVIVKVVLVVPA